MNRAERKAHEKAMRQFPRQLTPVDRAEWPAMTCDPMPFAVWRSRYFLVQLFDQGNAIRLSVNRVTVSANGRWDDGISWDDLQEIKTAVGYGDEWAVEIYPPDADEVNVANMRHLWVLPEPPEYGWRKHGRAITC